MRCDQQPHVGMMSPAGSTGGGVVRPHVRLDCTSCVYDICGGDLFYVRAAQPSLSMPSLVLQLVVNVSSLRICKCMQPWLL